MGDFSSADKREWAAMCEVTFPCETGAADTTTCDEVEACPEGWVHVGSLHPHCYGTSYEGPCRPLISISELGRIGNDVFEQECGVQFRCKGGTKTATQLEAALLDMA